MNPDTLTFEPETTATPADWKRFAPGLACKIGHMNFTLSHVYTDNVRVQPATHAWHDLTMGGFVRGAEVVLNGVLFTIHKIYRNSIILKPIEVLQEVSGVPQQQEQ